MATLRAFLQKRSVFVMLLAIFLAVMMPLYMLGFGMYRWGQAMAREEIIASTRAAVHFFIKTLETEISRIRVMQFETLNDSDIYYYVNASGILSTFERFQAQLSLQRRLDVMQHSSRYMLDAVLYLPRNGKMISAKGGVDGATESWKAVLAANVEDTPSGIIYAGERLYMAAAYPIIPANPDATPLYILIIELSSRDMRDLLLSFNQHPNGGVVMRSANHDWRLSGSNADSFPFELIDSVLSQESISIGGRRYLLAGGHSDYLNMDLFSYVPESDIFSGLIRYRNMFLLFTAVTLCLAGMFALACSLLIRKPMNLLVNNLRKVEHGDLSVRITHTAGDEFAYLYESFNRMTAAMQELFELNYRQQLLTQKAELRQLQAQINPHFLYNSFFTLYRMAKDEDYETITELLTHLSDYYRYITRDARMEVRLAEEVSHAYDYARIQQMRFSQRITMALAELPEQWAYVMVPRLILQPLIENAIDHGLKDVMGGGLLDVSFSKVNDTLVLAVENNGSSLTDEQLAELSASLDDASDWRESTGMVNIHRRLKLKFGAKSGIALCHGERGGLRAEMRLNIVEEQ